MHGGDLTGACEYLLRALDSARDAFGADEPEVLWTAHLLARLRREAGAPAAARRLLEESLAAGELRLGDREPVMLAIAYELATLAEELGNRHEARRNFSRVAAAGPALAATYTIDLAHSNVKFKVRHLVSKTSGEFNEFSGTIVADFDNLDSSSVKFVIDAANDLTNVAVANLRYQ